MTRDIRTSSIVKRSEDHVATDMAGETVVLDMKSGMYYGMDEVGALIWGLIQEPRNVSEIHDAVLAAYDVDAETCSRDVAAFLNAMETAGLVEISDEAST